MSESNLLTPPQDPERTRNVRSQSLKTQSQTFLFPPRPKRRTLSLPSKPVIPPFIIIQGCRDNHENDSEEEGSSCELNKDGMGKPAEKFCSDLFVCYPTLQSFNSIKAMTMRFRVNNTSETILFNVRKMG